MTFIELSLVVYYFTTVLLLTDKAGPFSNPLQRITWVGEAGVLSRPVNLFDRIRRIFGAYGVVKDESGNESLWMVDEYRAAVWMCPVCLSFWVALVVSAIWALVFASSYQLFFLYWFVSAGGSTFIHRITK